MLHVGGSFMATGPRGRSGVVIVPAVVAGCGQNGGRRHHPSGWWRRPVG
jgi:hypothetical protein